MLFQFIKKNPKKISYRDDHRQKTGFFKQNKGNQPFFSYARARAVHEVYQATADCVCLSAFKNKTNLFLVNNILYIVSFTN